LVNRRMKHTVDLYNTSYSHHASQVYTEVRAETYGEDLGQTGWMTASEFRSYFEMLKLHAGSHVLEVGCGSGGCAVYMAEKTGARVTGVDINESGIRNGRRLAEEKGLGSRVQFEQVDATQPLPFEDKAFDAVFSNDAVCHIAGRLNLFRQWRRVLKPAGRVLFTDALIITGMLTNEELATRASIGYYLFPPAGENERLIREAGLELLQAENVTEGVVRISQRWMEARARLSADLAQIEGEANFAGLQKFLSCVHTVSAERRLSRFAYLAQRPKP
jgi:cyclopropane fatty-acyl-phospholipid synthase-like methyltransferase